MAITATTTTNANGAPISFTSFADGLDTNSLIQKLVQIRSQNLTNLQTEKTNLTTKQSAYTTLAGKLAALQSAVSALSNSTTYTNAVAATVDQPSVLSATAAPGTLQASYNVTVLNRSSATRLTSSAAISTGSGIDTTKALNNGSGLAAMLSSTTGSFTINGTTINYDASQDTLSDVIDRINASGAGVNAMYDKLADKVILTNRTNGATAVNVSDVSGNLASALNITTSGNSNDGVTVMGTNAQITIDGINNGNPISSNDDMFTDSETGIVGLSLSLTSNSGSTQVTVGSDPTPIVSAVNNFVSAYNDVQDYISTESQYGVSKPLNADGTTAADGEFAGDQAVSDLASTLRQMVGNQVNLSGQYNYLGAAGISTTGTAADLSVDTNKLTTALTADPASVQKLFADPAVGVFTNLTTYIQQQTTMPDGLIQDKNTSISDQLNVLTDSITREQENVDAYSQNITNQFAAMETAVSSYSSGLNQLLSALPTGGTTPTAG